MESSFLEHSDRTPADRLELGRLQMNVLMEYESCCQFSWSNRDPNLVQEDPTAPETVNDWITQIPEYPQGVDPSRPSHPIVYVGPSHNDTLSHGWMTPNQLLSEINKNFSPDQVNEQLLNTLFTKVMYQRDFARLIRITLHDLEQPRK
jgi:hypothetical protein